MNKLSRTLLILSVILFYFPLSLANMPAKDTATTQVDGWHPETPRDELMPGFNIATPLLFNGKPVLEISSVRKTSSNGWWTRSQAVSPGKHYRFQTHFLATDVEEQYRCVLARLIWEDSAGKQAALPEYPETLPETDKTGWSVIQGTYKAPDDAASAKMELIFRWSPTGRVLFRDTSLSETAPQEPREVTLATVHFRPRESRSAHSNLVKFAEFIGLAGEKGSDIVCLPEAITLIGTGNSYLDSSESIPGPTTDFLGDIARQNDLYILANIYEREEEAVYNTSVLLDRQGKIAGKYRKVSLPREEIDGGLTPGNSFNVFDTDFGRIGLMTCWDVFYPVPARTLSAKGAEIVFLPIWGGNINLARARAIENQIYLVSSSYDMRTAVFNREGRIIAEGTEKNPVAIVTIDLNKRTLWPWLGDFRSRIPREKPPVQTGQVTTRAVFPQEKP